MEEALKLLSQKIERHKNNIQTEEATKTAFIIPFITLLGYDFSNPEEVVPEFTADIGTKKGEKVDYALLKNDTPVLIIECKHWKEDLDAHKSQLHRYFSVTGARFALLTNGIKYFFFSDLDDNNKMDEKPFLELNMEKIRDSHISELSKFHKSNFDVDSILSAAGNMKYVKAIREIIESEFTNPSEELVRFFTRMVYPGNVTAKLIEQFTPIIKKALSQHTNEIINDRLKSAIKKETEEQQEEMQLEPVEENKIETTEEEIEGFNIVRAVLSQELDPQRVHARDTQSYFGILLDNNNRQPLCRLHFNRKKKYLGVFDRDKNEEKILLDNIIDIYQHSERLIESIKLYE